MANAHRDTLPARPLKYSRRRLVVNHYAAIWRIFLLGNRHRGEILPASAKCSRAQQVRQSVSKWANFLMIGGSRAFRVLTAVFPVRVAM